MAFNPFEHHHHHDHDDDHAHDHDVLTDPAQKSLADALRTSFTVLKLVMVVLVVLFLGSGIFVVDQGEVAIVTRFGQVVGTGEGQIIQPGKLHFSFPYPIDQIVRIPTSENRIELKERYWYASGDQTKTADELAASAGASLNPMTTGSLITGDANIVHTQWIITYQITDPVKFLKNIADTKKTNKAKMVADAEAIIKAACEEGIVFAMAQVTADDVIKKQTAAAEGLARLHAQKMLDDLESGITIRKLNVSDTAMPLSVRQAFQRVIDAENQGAQERSNAQKQREEILGGAAGEAHAALWSMVREYELATEARNKAEIDRLDAAFRKAFTEKQVTLADGRKVAISGEAASMISRAEAYRNEIESSARRDAETFRNLKAEYDANPRIFLNRQWEATKQRIFSNPDVEVFYLPPSQIRLFLNRDPAFIKAKEARDQAEAAAAKQNGTAPR